MNIIFFASSQFAIPSLKALIANGYDISYIVTQPDRPKGRGLHFEATPVKRVASEAGIKVYQPENINGSDAIKFLKGLNPDLFIVISYGQILSEDVLNIPKMLTINIHASLLPKYRGAAPINWAIIKGEKITGITVIKMTQDLDAGPIILQKEVDIEDEDTSITLEDRLSKEAQELLVDSLKLIENKTYKLRPQDENRASFSPKLKKEDGLINWESQVRNINNLIRGCIPWPGAFTYYKGKLLKIHKAEIVSVSGYKNTRTPGEIIQVSKEVITVATREGDLKIRELQIEGRRKMMVEEFIIGHRISVGEILGKK
jgi:methionyl-tRNA formyltransferase